MNKKTFDDLSVPPPNNIHQISSLNQVIHKSIVGTCQNTILWNWLFLIIIAPLIFSSCQTKKKQYPKIGPLSAIPVQPSVSKFELSKAKNLRPSEPTRTIILPRQKIPNLSRYVNLDFKGIPLSKVLQKWSDGCGINIAIHPDLFKFRRSSDLPIWLKVKKMPAIGALEWICRMSDVWYVVVNNGIWIVPDYGWYRTKSLEVRLILTGGLFYDKGEDFLDFLIQCNRVFLQNNPRTRLSLNVSSGKLMAVLPLEGLKMVTRVIHELEINKSFQTQNDQLASSIKLPLPPPPTIKIISPTTLPVKLERTIRAIYSNSDVQEIISDLVEHTGINIAVDRREIPKALHHIDIALGYVSCRTLLDELIKKCHLRRVKVEPERGLWISGSTKQIKSSQTRQLAWPRVVFRSYPARALVQINAQQINDLAKQKKQLAHDKEKLLNFLVKKIGGNWNEPTYAIGYNVPTGRVLLQHEIEVHRKIPSFLRTYRKAIKWSRSQISDLE